MLAICRRNAILDTVSEGVTRLARIAVAVRQIVPDAHRTQGRLAMLLERVTSVDARRSLSGRGTDFELGRCR